MPSPLEPLFDARRDERNHLVDLALRHTRSLSDRMDVAVAIVGGSVARGYFNRWSDVDLLLVVEEGLPDGVLDRAELVERDRPGRVQSVALTPNEFKEALRRHNRLVVEAVDTGIVLRGRERLTQLVAAAGL